MVQRLRCPASVPHITLFTLGLAACALGSCKVRLRTAAPPPLATTYLDPSGAMLGRSTLQLHRTLPLDKLLGPAEDALVHALIASHDTSAPAVDDRATIAATRSPDGPTADESATETDVLAPPTPAGTYRAPVWAIREGERATRAMFFPGPVATTVDALGQITLTASFDVAAAAAANPHHQRGTPLSCACDGSTWCGGQNQPLKRATVRWTLPPAYDEGWHLTGQAVQEITLDEPCEISISRSQSIDLTQTLEQELRDITEPLGEVWAGSLARTALPRAEIDALWESFTQPIPHAHRPGWSLHWQPRGIASTGWQVDGDDVQLGLQLQLRPVLVEDRAIEPRPLPPPTAPLEPAGLSVVSEVLLTKEVLAAPIGAALVGRRYPPRPANTLQVTDVEVYGTKQGAAVRLEVGGAATGDLHFVGRIDLDQELDELFLTEVAPTPDTQAALAGLYDEVETWSLEISRTPWVPAGALTAEIIRAARWPLGPSIRALQAGVDETVRAHLGTDSQPTSRFTRHAYHLHRMDAQAARVLVVISTESVATEADGDSEAPQ